MRRYLINRNHIERALRLLAEKLAVVSSLRNPTDVLVDSFESAPMASLGLIRFAITQLFLHHAISSDSSAEIVVRYLRMMGIDVDMRLFYSIPRMFDWLFIPVHKMRIMIRESARRILVECVIKACKVAQEMAGFLTYRVHDNMLCLDEFHPITLKNPHSAYVDVRGNLRSLERILGSYPRHRLIFLHSHPDGRVCPSRQDMYGLVRFFMPMGVAAARNGSIYLTVVFFRHRKTVKIWDPMRHAGASHVAT